MKWCVGLLLTLCAAGACIRIMGEPEPDNPESQEVTVSFDTYVSSPESKSSISPSESRVRDINIIAYHNGSLAAAMYTEDIGNLELTLSAGKTYNLYAAANVGRMIPCTGEDEFLASASYIMDSLEDMSVLMPLVWKRDDLYVKAGMSSVEIVLVRLVSRLSLRIDSEALQGLEIVSARLCQSPLVVRPFRDGGSAAEDPMEVTSGDHASATDLEVLNSGGKVLFYSLENLQGNLLKDNEDPREKVPDNLPPDKRALCTYLEVRCIFTGVGVYDGEVTYRIYVGTDNCRNFDVVRNSDMNISLALTGGGLNEMSWRVDADVDVRDGYAFGEVSACRHDLWDMYVGERFIYEVELASELLEYIGPDPSVCKVAFVPDDGEDAGMEFSPLSECDGLCFAEGVCTSASRGSIWLCHPDGRLLTCLNRVVSVSDPYVRFCSMSCVGDYETVPDDIASSVCEINGDPLNIYVYLTDGQGYNLNASSFHGFDLSMFEFDDRMNDDCYFDVSPALNMSKKDGGEASGGYSVMYEIKCRNDGKDGGLSQNLADVCGLKSDVSLCLLEKIHSLQAEVDVNLAMLPVRLSLVDNGWAGWHDSQLSLVVENPSSLPLDILVWQLCTAKNLTNVSLRDQVAAYVEDKLDIMRWNCVGNTWLAGTQPIYGSYSALRLDRSMLPSDVIEDGELLVCPLNGINTTDIYNSLLYDLHGQQNMFHLVDVMVGEHTIDADKIILDNMLDNGDVSYGYIYGPEGWNERGLWLFSDDVLLSGHSAMPCGYHVTPKSLSRVNGRNAAGVLADLNFRYDSEAGQLYVWSSKASYYDVSLDFRLTGTVSGFVRTYPNGTKLGPKYNRCSVDIDEEIMNVPLAGAYGISSADDGAIKDAFERIYAHTYTDSKGNVTSTPSYMHHAHPVSMTMNIEVKLSSRNRTDLIPIEFIWDDVTLTFYHTQEDEVYDVAVTPALSTGSFVRVRRK